MLRNVWGVAGGCKRPSENLLLAEFIALGKTVMINPDLAALIESGREAEIVCEPDSDKADRYRIPERLWQQCQMGPAYLPPVKGSKNRQPVDI